MTKVINEAGRTVVVLRWRILPDGRTVGPTGEVKDELPDDIACSAQAKRLADMKLISIPGYLAGIGPTKPEKVLVLGPESALEILAATVAEASQGDVVEDEDIERELDSE